MRILLLAQFYPPVIGGEERHVRNLAVGLAAAGHDVHVGTLRTDPLDGTLDTDAGVRVHRLDHLGDRLPFVYGAADRPLAFPFPDPLTTRDLARLARRVRPDVVHAHNWIVNSWVALPDSRRIPLVYSLHDYSHVCATKRLMFEESPCPGPAPARCLPCTRRHYGNLKGPAIYAAVQAGRPLRQRRVDLFTPVSHFVAEANRLDALGAPWTVVPNFVPDDLLGAEPTRDPALPAEHFLFFAGDLTVEKGVTTLLAAYDRLPANRPDLLLVGRPHEPLRLPKGARLEHSWPHERVLSGFRHCLAAVLPSEWPDPCPTTVIEALALGAPLVTTSEGGIADMVTDNESAVVVAAGNADALTAALDTVCTSPLLRARLAENGVRRAGAFVRSRVVAQLSHLYEGLATR